ncbi:Cytoplasmic GTPase/eEF2-like protein (ribosomal biogenesis), partial [Tulasnella sp. 427]
MLYPDISHDATTEIKPKNKLEEDLYSCDDGPNAGIVAYVSKMFAVKSKEMPENKRKAMTADEMRAAGRAAREARAAAGATSGEAVSIPLEVPTPSEDDGLAADSAKVEEEGDDEVLLGFARLYSGTISRGSKLFCVLPKFNPALPPSHPSNVKHLTVIDIAGLYVMMGRELVPVETVKAGNVFAVAGLAGIVGRNGTLCGPGSGFGRTVDIQQADAEKECLVNLAGISGQAAPIVRVALEPENPSDLPKLVKGLRLLNQADPCVETFQQETGEYVILTAGELHLERCLKDLRERFAKVEIQASQPIVPYREMAVKAPDMAPPKTPNAKRGTIQGSTAQNLVTFTVRAVPLPQAITDFLLANMSILKRLYREGQQKKGGENTPRLSEGSQHDSAADDAEITDEISRQATVKPEDFWKSLDALCKKAGGEWVDVADKIWAFGPHRIGPNILVDKMTGAASLRKKSQKLNLLRVEQAALSSSTPEVGTPTASIAGEVRYLRDFDDCFETAFQIATNQGPLCAEPMQGMAFFVESVQLGGEGSAADAEADVKVQSKTATVRGALITAVKEAYRSGLLDWSPRLMLAMYSCDIQAATDVLGKVYAVVARRKGRIVSEEMKEGTSFFTIRAMLPVVESFGFADDIRKRTSGAASPQLIFSGYEVLDLDPFWVPTTEEELEDLGEKADRANVARLYMDAVRKRKGMFVDQKIVEFAEKQRT